MTGRRDHTFWRSGMFTHMHCHVCVCVFQEATVAHRIYEMHDSQRVCVLSGVQGACIFESDNSL